MALHIYTQNLVNAQVEVNRSVWASNTGDHFKTEDERNEYIRKCVESAIVELNEYLKKSQNLLF